MNNSDFKRLLTTNDKELITELTKPKAANKAKKRERPPPGKGKDGKGAGKGGAKGKGGKGKGDSEPKKGLPAGPAGNQYRDRAKERRELKGEYEKVAEEFENHADLSLDESKYLGGDLDHTHLVKGLDYALLTKVRTEMTKHKKSEEIQQIKLQKVKGQEKRREFQSDLGPKVWKAVVDNLHPHHSTFKQRMDKMCQALSLGQNMRSVPNVFLPGRMCYEFEHTNEPRDEIPRIVFISKEDAPRVDASKKVAPILQSTISKVREAFQRGNEERKQRKKDKAQRPEPVYAAVAQKVAAAPAPTKVKARDADNDIFQGAGGFDTTELAKKSTKLPFEAPSRASSSKATARSDTTKRHKSYFDDAGAEKYQRGPEGQIELQEFEVEEHASGNVEASIAAGNFEAASRYVGSKVGWVFKLGPLGLGYYVDTVAHAAAKAKAEAAKAAKAAKAGKQAAATAQRGSRGKLAAPDAEDDAYGECFPSAGLGNAFVHTGDKDSDAEDEEGKKKKEKPGAKKAAKAGETMSANQKNAEAKKRKLTEVQEWQKIDSMIKKGKHSSIADLEAAARPKRNAPVPREIMSTPAFF